MSRILLLMTTRTYRARAFLRAARRLDVEVVVGSERAAPLSPRRRTTTLAVEVGRPDVAVAQIVAEARERPFDAIVGIDDAMVVLAARASAALGLPHNDPDAVRATRDKLLMRRRLADAGVRSPGYRAVDLDTPGAVESAAAGVSYPCVLKPLSLSASRGVIRVDDAAAFVAAAARIERILADAAEEGDDPPPRTLLVEGFIPGCEVALEGMLVEGRLDVLALFDKPDRLDGPFFEETIYVTPSRLTPRTQAAIVAETNRAARALGLRDGPVHAELRWNDAGAWVVEIAARSIGGLCSDTLEFSGGRSLEELILLRAVGEELGRVERAPEPSGVMMLPIPHAGVLRAVHGLDQAHAVAGIVAATISMVPGDVLVPLPEGGRYLGFLFARAATPDGVEAALRAAHACLRFEIDAIEPAADGSWMASATGGRC